MYHMIVNPASRSGRGEKIWHTLLPVLKKNQTAYNQLDIPCLLMFQLGTYPHCTGHRKEQ